MDGLGVKGACIKRDTIDGRVSGPRVMRRWTSRSPVQSSMSVQSPPVAASEISDACDDAMDQGCGEREKVSPSFDYPMIGYAEQRSIGMKRMGSAAKKSRSAGYVLCVTNRRYPASLELLKVYRALRDDAARRDGFVRVIDESGEDYLYPKDYFVPIE